MESFKDYCTEDNYKQYLDLAIYDDLDKLLNLFKNKHQMVNMEEKDFEIIGKGHLIAYYIGYPRNYKKIFTDDEEDHNAYLIVGSKSIFSIDDLRKIINYVECPKNVNLTISSLVDEKLEEPVMLVLFYE